MDIIPHHHLNSLEIGNCFTVRNLNVKMQFENDYMF